MHLKSFIITLNPGLYSFIIRAFRMSGSPGFRLRAVTVIFTSQLRCFLLPNASILFEPILQSHSNYTSYITYLLHWPKKHPWAIVTCCIPLCFAKNVCEIHFSQMVSVFAKSCFKVKKNIQNNLSFKPPNGETVRNFKFMTGPDA